MIAHIPPIMKLLKNNDCVKKINPENKQMDAIIIG